MGTRGAYGFYHKGITKVIYNHFDSYPEVLGMKMVNYCRTTSEKNMKDVFSRLTKVREDVTEKDRKMYQNIDFRDNSWYSTLRDIQGEPNAWNDISGPIPYIDAEKFLENSLFCEWAYIINLDVMELEVYKGWQKEMGEGRYSGGKVYKIEDKMYYPVTLILMIPISETMEGISL